MILAEYIVQNIKPPISGGAADKPIWMLDAEGIFTMKFAW